MTGGALLARYAPARLLDSGVLAEARQAAAAQVDPLEARRAQMGATPIASTPLGDSLVMLSGPGGNVVVLHGTDGKVVVDGFVLPAWPRLKSALDAIDKGPINMMIDTHWHFDHADNNANFRAAGAVIVAQENTKTRMSQPHDLLGMHISPSPAAALPTETFGASQSIRANGEQVDMMHVAPAHTDTDILVHYPKANVLHMGDTFFNGFYPFIDAGTGGNINGMIAAAEHGLTLANATTKIVPGHGPLGDRAALDSYRNVLATVRDRVRTQKGAGKTLAEVQAAKPSAEFDATWGKGMLSPDAFIGLVYSTL
jgi:glyoxylase-like metal-dependent hydrolase (beta-lactamase superfamily II)